jgi:hypothetical protein
MRSTVRPDMVTPSVETLGTRQQLGGFETAMFDFIQGQARNTPGEFTRSIVTS